jgi:hypothetical protein
LTRQQEVHGIDMGGSEALNVQFSMPAYGVRPRDGFNEKIPL